MILTFETSYFTFFGRFRQLADWALRFNLLQETGKRIYATIPNASLIFK
jgi:hypothetical protein